MHTITYQNNWLFLKILAQYNKTAFCQNNAFNYYFMKGQDRTNSNTTRTGFSKEKNGENIIQ